MFTSSKKCLFHRSFQYLLLLPSVFSNINSWIIVFWVFLLPFVQYSLVILTYICILLKERNLFYYGSSNHIITLLNTGNLSECHTNNASVHPGVGHTGSRLTHYFPLYCGWKVLHAHLSPLHGHVFQTPASTSNALS